MLGNANFGCKVTDASWERKEFLLVIIYMLSNMPSTVQTLESCKPDKLFLFDSERSMFVAVSQGERTTANMNAEETGRGGRAAGVASKHPSWFCGVRSSLTGHWQENRSAGGVPKLTLFSCLFILSHIYIYIYIYIQTRIHTHAHT